MGFVLSRKGDVAKVYWDDHTIGEVTAPETQRCRFPDRDGEAVHYGYCQYHYEMVSKVC